MRIAVLSDIHGNRTAFEAVVADLRQTSPDTIVHGGDLADAGSSPVEIVDRIRDLGWTGVVGNTDEMLFRPASLEEFAGQSAAPPQLWEAIREMAEWTRSLLGEERIAWLRALPRVLEIGTMALVHARPDTLWKAPATDATDEELEAIYAPLGHAVAVYGHIHRPVVRALERPRTGLRVVANTGSVGQSHDGDRRAAYLLLDGEKAEIRRVEYDIEAELRALGSCGLPHAEWIERMLRTGVPQMPGNSD